MPDDWVGDPTVRKGDALDKLFEDLDTSKRNDVLTLQELLASFAPSDQAPRRPRPASPSPATHAVWIHLKAGETVYCILCRGYYNL